MTTDAGVNEELVERLRATAKQLRNNMRILRFGGDEVHVRVKSPDLLLLDLEDAANTLSALPPVRVPEGWRSMDSAPRDGTPIVVRARHTYRYQPYKPEGQRQMKADGRWQRSNGYGGWENCEEPAGDWAISPPPPGSTPPREPDDLVEALEGAPTLTPLHVKLLQRGASRKSGRIWLSDDMMFRVGEIGALADLRRWGLAEHDKGPFPPGPPAPTPDVITEAGRRALTKAKATGGEG